MMMWVVLLHLLLSTSFIVQCSLGIRWSCNKSTGLAGSYPCKNVNIESIVDFETLTSIGGIVDPGSALTSYATAYDGSQHEMCDLCRPFIKGGSAACYVARIEFYLQPDTCALFNSENSNTDNADTNNETSSVLSSTPLSSSAKKSYCESASPWAPQDSSHACNEDVQAFCEGCKPFIDCLFLHNSFDRSNCIEFYNECGVTFRPLCRLGNRGADIWGFSQDGRDFVATCMSQSTTFLDVTDASNPQFLGYMPATNQTSPSTWCDIKIVKDANDDPVLYKVSEAPGHGVQVLNLARLQNVTTPQTFTADYTIGNSSAHNIAINEDSGMVYIVGQRDCPIGMTIFNPRTGLQPGCFGDFGYVHDADCVVYRGPDTRFQRQEICVIFTPMPIFQQNGTLTQIDGVQIISVVLAPNSSSDVSFQKISGFRYPHQHYPHQGWFSEDHRYLIFSDELDEIEEQINTTTYIYDLMNLSVPVPMPSHVANFNSVDHNLYFFQGRLYQSDYTRGLRVFNFDPSLISTNTDSSPLIEVAYLETATNSTAGRVLNRGAWSSYQFEPTNGGTTKVVISTVELGVFIVTVDLENIASPSSESLPTVTPSGMPTVAPTTAAPFKIVDLAPLPSLSSGPSGGRDNVMKLVCCLVGVAAIVMAYLY
mmetsp:Transcript_18960/g.27259  ORF Transcript_18960/g.27259 Transcript_18960/m.27259 type:complete len:651 (+) Transcript_18960:43-1995(+)